ncbi:hypothetical protein ABIA39_005278 [Nocardia sp. GAS34]|uniref:hypothetical protein n=1 Tax=unclassified Nocardia TaxID=2637762 RepID=UPI003D1D6FAB
MADDKHIHAQSRRPPCLPHRLVPGCLTWRNARWLGKVSKSRRDLTWFDDEMSNPFDPEIEALLAGLPVEGADATAREKLRDVLLHRYDIDLPFSVLPELAAIVSDGSPSDRTQAVLVAGALIADADPYTAEIRDQYADSIAVLLAEVQSELAESRPGEQDHEPDTFIARVEAMLTFEDATVWSRRLDGLIDEEFEIECPVCWAAMMVYLGGPGFFTCTSGYPLDNVTKRPLIPIDPDQMTDLGARLHQLALIGRQHTIARQLTFLFGRATCTENGHEFTPADAIEKAAMS